MNLKYRRALYLPFFLVFFIVAPILVLYTAGYSYNFTKNKLEKTGIITLDSQPNKAAIYLNGKYRDDTPARITRLLPNTYNLEVSKEGYYSWIKEANVKSNLTAFYQDIILFKKNLPVLRIEGEVNILNISPSQEKIIYSLIKDNVEELRLLNLNNDSDFLIHEFNRKTYNELHFVQWSPSQNKALIKQQIGDFDKYLIINIETLKTKELFDITRLNFSQANWNNADDNHLYALRKKVLHQIDLIDNTTLSLLSDHISDFRAEGDVIYYITELGNESFLNRKVLDEDKIEKIKLPSPSSYTLQSSPDDLIVLIDTKNQDLFIISEKVFDSKNIENEIILQANAKDIYWSENKQNLIYCNDFELWSYNLNTNQNELINRYGQVINQAFWYPGNKYIIYQTQNEIKVVETESQGVKNDLTLAKLEQLDKAVVNNTGKYIYFQAKIGNQQGIFKLEIQ